MKPNQNAYTSQFPFGAAGQQTPAQGFPYPGLEQFPYAGGYPQNFPGVLPPTGAAPAAGAAAGAGSGFNFAKLKTMIDGMGGIDGIIGTMTKFQRIFANIQQMAPMLKLLMGSFGKAKTTGARSAAPTKRRRSGSASRPGNRGRQRSGPPRRR